LFNPEHCHKNWNIWQKDANYLTKKSILQKVVLPDMAGRSEFREKTEARRDELRT
jgi:hypothetical protein